MITPNTRIGRYLIESVLGVGGMGEVFLATDTELHRKVAIKCLSHKFSEDPELIRRFTQEAKAASALNHPNIITVYEIVKTEDAQFIATEYIDGSPLTDKISSGLLVPELVLGLAVQIVSALDAAHSAGIVHRDIKPDNIMIRPDGLVKILDFGIAKLSEPPAVAGGKDGVNSDDSAKSSAHADGTDMEAATAIQSGTTPGMIIGTANYMSPEQARGQQVDQQTDIFSFGVVFYEMLSGTSPFAGGTVSDILAAVLMKEPKPLENIPPKLSAIVKKTLQKDKNKRFQTAKDLLDDLKEIKRDLEIQSHLERTASPDLKDQDTQILNIQTSAKSKSINSIVVLPFQNIGGDAKDEYFSDGLTDEIISDLSNIRSMRVISRNSAMSLKGTTKDIKTITQELNVRYVLGGSVRKAGQNFRISVQLIDGATDANLWAEKFSGSIDDIFDIQESVSRSIADALKITLTTGEIEQIEERPIADGRAYDLYLQAKANFNQIVPETLNRSIELLKQGLEIIGENELLYAALGYTYYSYFRWISKLDENYLRQANECLEKTFALNPDSSHGFVLKGLLSYSHGKMPEAIESLSIAVESDPTNVEALFWLIVNLNYIGKGKESKKLVERIISIDPLTPMNIFLGGFVPVYTGEFEESLPFVERALAIDESSPLLIWSAVVIKAWCGKTEEAIADADRLAEIAPGWVYTEHALFLKHAFRGEKELALQHYTPDFDKEAQYDCHFALHVAHCFALINENEKALDFLEIAVQTGMVNHPFLSHLDPLLENIRGEQRFKDLIQEAERLSEEISFAFTAEHAKSVNVEEASTQIFHPPTTTEKRAGSTTGSEEGFRVAVLPFKYRGANDELETLAEGLSEEIVTGLSRFPYLRVISRGSALTDEISGSDLRTTGEEFGIRYVLEGSLRQVGTTARIAVQLVETTTGEHLWAETYDRKLESERIFEIQDELVSRVVSTIADWHGVLVHSMAGSLRNKDIQQLTPDEAVLYSFGYFERLTPEDHFAVRDLMERVVEEFPDKGNCWAMLAILYCNEYMYGFNLRPDPLGRALTAAQRAVELEPANYLASQSLAFAYFFRRNFAAFEPLATRTIALNRMCGGTVAILGIFFACSGEWERGCKLGQDAMELNPHFPGWYRLPLMFNDYRQSKYQEALNEAQKINIPNYFWTLVFRAAAFGQLGESEKALEALDELISSRPDIAGKTPEEFGHWFDNDFVEHLMEGLRKAGFENTSAPDQNEQKTQIQTANPAAEDLLPTIAILPFKNMSSDEENEYFCDGLAEELLNALSKIEDLKVAARTSAFSFKGKNADVSEIGEKLSVKNVLEGSVRKSGNKLRISVQLINASDGYQLWSERYDREMEDIFDVQDEITLAVVDALKVKLFDNQNIARKYEPKLAAYEAFLKGRYKYYKFTPEAFAEAETYFKEAIDLDKEWADPHSALGDLYFILHFYGWRPQDAMIPLARDSALLALKLDSNQSMAHAVLGAIAALHDYDWKEAENQFRLANLSESRDSNVRFYFAMFYLLPLGKFDEAKSEIDAASLSDPLNVMWHARKSWMDVCSGEYENAITQAKKALDLNEADYQSLMMIALSYFFQGNLSKARLFSERVYKRAPFDDLGSGLFAGILARDGENERAKEVIEKLTGSATFGTMIRSLVCDEIDQAIDWYEKDLDLRRPNAPMVANAEFCRPLRNHPRWTSLAKRMNLAESESASASDKPTDESLEAKTVMLRADEATSESSAKDSITENVKVEEISEPTINPKSKIQNPKSKWRLFGLLGLIVLVVGFFGYNYYPLGTKQIESIAVMPFVNESGNEDVEYLSDGMTETLISSLTEIPNLSVKARSSVFYYKGKNTSPKQIGEELNVEAILLGRVTQRGDDLKLSLELVETKTLNAIWSESYNRKMSDLVSLQSEIAKNVSDKLRLKLTANEQKQIAKTYTTNSEAQKLYLKGRFHWNKREIENIEKAEQYFKQAIEKDPKYALAYSGLADSYALIPIYGGFRPKEYFPRAKQAAQKALAFDDDLAEAHASLANVIQTYEYDWANAEKEYKRALELNPNYASAHHWYGEHLSTKGDHDQAIKELETALKLDPFSRVINRNMGFTLYAAGKYDEAIVQLKKSIELFPEDSWGYLFLGDTYAAKGNYDLAVGELITYFKLDGKSSETINRYEDAYKKDGWKGFWSAHMNDQLAERAAMREKNPSAYLQNWRIAQIYATIGNKDKTFEYLKTAIDEREPDIIYISVVHYYDPMRDDPRFVELMKKVGFPQIK